MRETAENMRRAKVRNQAVEMLYGNPRQQFSGSLPVSSTQRGTHRPSVLAQNPISPFSRAGVSYPQLLSANRSPGRNYFAEALSPSRPTPIYSQSDMTLLRQRLNRAENEILMREESCKVCGMVFLKSSTGAEDTVR